MSPGPVGVYVCSIILVFTATLAASLRLVIRATKKVKIGLDDYFVFASLLLVWSLFIVLIIGTQRGTIGTHTLQVPQTQHVIVTWHEQDIAKLEYISQALATVCYGMIKISALLLFTRVTDSSIFRWISRTTIVIVTFWTVGFFFANVFQCGEKPAWFWESPITLAEHCGRSKHIMLGYAVSDLALALVVLVIPMPMIWTLYTTRSQKCGLLTVFGLGYLSAAASVIRLVVVVNDVYRTTVGARDVRGIVTNYMLLSYIEAALGVIAISLPALKPLLHTSSSEDTVAGLHYKPSIDSATTIMSQFSRPSVSESKNDISTSTNAVARGQLYRMTSGTHIATVEHTKRAGLPRNLSQTDIFVSREFRVHESD